MVQNIDIFPTIVDMFSNQSSDFLKQFQGNSLISKNINKRGYNFAISELFKPWQNPPDPNTLPPLLKKYWNRVIVSYRSNDFKYIHSSRGNHEFYDIIKEPGGRNNIIDNIPEKKLEKIRKIIARYNLMVKYDLYKDRLTGKKSLHISTQRIIKRLKSKGYV